MNGLASFFAGTAGALGLGGGGVLVLYLTLYLHMQQKTAQGINLIFFIPCAVLSVIINRKKQLLNFKSLIPIIGGGIIGAIIGVISAGLFEPLILKKIFAVFLMIIGAKELFAK